MAKKASSAPAAQRIWRMTAAAPMGEYVNPKQDAEKVLRIAEPEVTHGGWIESSFDLLRGVDVTEWSDTQTPE